MRVVYVCALCVLSVCSDCALCAMCLPSSGMPSSSRSRPARPLTYTTTHHHTHASASTTLPCLRLFFRNLGSSISAMCAYRCPGAGRHVVHHGQVRQIRHGVPDRAQLPVQHTHDARLRRVEDHVVHLAPNKQRQRGDSDTHRDRGDSGTTRRARPA